MQNLEDGQRAQTETLQQILHKVSSPLPIPKSTYEFPAYLFPIRTTENVEALDRLLVENSAAFYKLVNLLKTCGGMDEMDTLKQSTRFRFEDELLASHCYKGRSEKKVAFVQYSGIIKVLLDVLQLNRRCHDATRSTMDKLFPELLKKANDRVYQRKFKSLDDGKFILHTEKFQRILCGISHFIGLAMYATALRHSLDDLSKETPPLAYFSLFQNICSVSYKTMVVKAIWTKHNVLLEIVNFPCQGQQKRKTSGFSISLESPIFILSICSMSLAIALLRLRLPTTHPIGLFSIKQISSSENTWYRSLKQEAMYIFCIQNESISPTVESVLHGVTLLLLVSKFIMSCFDDIFILMNILTLYCHVSRFLTTLRTTNLVPQNFFLSKPQVDAFGIVGNYRSLQKLSKLINNAVGKCLVYFVGEGLCAYAMALKEVLVWDNKGRVVILMFYYVDFLCVLFASASICRRMQEFRNWLDENEPYLELSPRQLALLLDSISRDSVAIEMSGIANINFSLVGTVSLVISLCS
ncbi:unnamed protein product [Orchesella dallaii]|uniref:DUF4806 domain-containing protein n=1 Tax=Orchesella dallaii TaxID=48710 RepID=A0ABP1RV95_9HEXA